MKSRLLKISGFIFIVAILVFIFQNLETVEIAFLGLNFSGPVALAITIATFVGFFIGLFFMWPTISSQRSRIKELQNEHRILKNKLNDCAIEYRSEGLGSSSNNSI